MLDKIPSQSFRLAAQHNKIIAMENSSILDALNPAQRSAVTCERQSLLVLAGAGSGKTRVLVHRIAWLVQQRRLPASAVLAVTFTNKAAREMRYRLGDLLQMNPQGLWVGTFHGLAHRLLKTHWQAAGLPQHFQILDSDDQLRLIKRLIKEQGLDDSRFAPKAMQWYINGHKDEGRRAEYVDSHGDPYEKTRAALYLSYQSACQRSGQVDFGELLLRAQELWLNNPALLAHYQERFQHILVDEFQDTNSVQYAWLRVLAGEHNAITVVGDDDQSIYGWRGAKIENIQQFGRDFRAVETIKLEQNYRSSGRILDAANAVIANNPGRLGKQLWTEGERGEAIALYAGYNDRDEAQFLVDRIEDHASEGTLLSEQAVLYRSNAQSRVIEEALIRAGTAYRIYGGQRFYDRLEIKNALAYLRLSYARDDDAAFERAINTPTRGIGAKTLEALRAAAREGGCSLWLASNQLLQQDKLSRRAATALAGFIALIEDCGAASSELALGELMPFVLEASELLLFHGRERGEKGRTRVENLQELVTACQQFEVQDEGSEDEIDPLRQFLDTAALDAGEQQAEEHSDAVQLMTLHSAKGLEFPVVYLAGVEENLFPHRMSMESPEQLEEERRLCYVGITRAKEQLYISYAETRNWYGQEMYNAVSRFVAEIPPDCLREVRPKASISRPLSATSFSSHNSTGLALGQRVLHGVFGEGVVLGVEGEAEAARVQVNFDREGSKWLVAAYAKLQPL